ncbi:hypothetical protein TNCV_46721 [Trichonephila clavipes]|nr:hypothetical protein TNCV_46721 [Trichonephila clavipes]
MWIDALSTAHIEQKNGLEIFALSPLERVKQKVICTGDALFALPENTFIALDSCVGLATYDCDFKQMVLFALKSSTDLLKLVTLFMNQPVDLYLLEMNDYGVSSDESFYSDVPSITNFIPHTMEPKKRH